MFTALCPLVHPTPQTSQTPRSKDRMPGAAPQASVEGCCREAWVDAVAAGTQGTFPAAGLPVVLLSSPPGGGGREFPSSLVVKTQGLSLPWPTFNSWLGS